MSRHDEREITRRLADTPAGDPPPELLDRLRADIPEDLTAGLEAEGGADDITAPTAAPTPFSRRWLATAATLLMVVAGGFLAWKLSQEVGPVGESYVDGPPAAERAESAEASDQAESGEAAGGNGTAASTAATEAADSAKATDPATAAAEPDSDAVGEELTARDERQESVAAAGNVAPSPPVAPRRQAAELHDRTAARELAEAEAEPEIVAEPVDAVEDAAGVNEQAAPDYPAAQMIAIPKPELARGAAPPPPPPRATPTPSRTEAERRRGQENLSISAENQAYHSLEEERKALERELEELDSARDAAPTAPPVHPVVETSRDRLSTFGLDVDTGSFTLLRGHLEAGRMPPAAAVRVEEVVNAQPFSDPFAAAPARPGETFRVSADGAPSPFAPDRSHRLLRFRVSAPALPPEDRKPVVLTLVVDVSGSMEGERLGLVRAGVGRLLESLLPEDRVALVVFSDDARLVAPHGEPGALAEAADALATEGGTNAEAGLALGYDAARQAFDPAAVNRVVLLSDGVANVGATGPEAILERVAAAAADGIELTTVGVGIGDYGDRMMETLADRGDGRYAYADHRREMERLFVEELDGTLQTVAEEARAQVEFDPRVVESWRQVGYENRAIADHEFRYDAVDAGEIGPGHSVTALYEVKLRAEPAPGRPLALLKLRWREPAGADGKPGRFREIEERLRAEDLAATWSAADPDLRLAAVAAELAEHLRRSPHAASAPSTLLTEARRLAAADVNGAAELVELAEAWRRLVPPAAEAEEPETD